ncbi:MAG TPA: CDP-alcohol phosphatidyltransferase family protein, partial [Rubrivivax sp.]|nr:CDP-alcohol phosphatidyltransferase family protein [Rubrivivax sp.]
RALGRVLVDRGVGADVVTLAGFLVGVTGALAIAAGQALAGLVLLLLSRLCDGLDGAVARQRKMSTKVGGY